MALQTSPKTTPNPSTGAKRGVPKGTKRGPREPGTTLTFNNAMWASLKRAAVKISKGEIAGALTLTAIVKAVQSTPELANAFGGHANLLTPQKVSKQIDKMREAGVSFPDVVRTRGESLDVEALNAIE